jgi:hypothetical protein
MSTAVKITEKTYCSTSTEESIFCFFIDNQLLYHCSSEEMAKIFLEDLVKDLEAKFKKNHTDHRVFIEKKNDWKFVVQRVRDGFLLSGKPRETHTVEIRRSQQLLKIQP